MKDRIMYLIIGVLLGAIITTAGFFIYNKVIVKEPMQTNISNQMQPPSNGNIGERPEKPDGEPSEEPPAKPENQNNNTNS